MKKLIVCLLSLIFILNISFVCVLAANDDLGTGQSQVHIHGVGDIGNNKDAITLIVGDNEYQGQLQGSKLTVEMDSSFNGFDFSPDESMEVGYRNGDVSGILILTHQEGNGNNINKEHDMGLNNFRGSLKPAEPAPTDPEPGDGSDPAPLSDDGEDPVPPTVEPDPNQPIVEPEQPDPNPGGNNPEPVVPVSEKPDPDPTPSYPYYPVNVIDIPDEEVPKIVAPKTGDNILAQVVITLMSSGGIGVLTLGKRKNLIF